MAKPNTQTPKAVAAIAGAAQAQRAPVAAQESKVLRDEQTYTTMLKEYHPMFKEGFYPPSGTGAKPKAPIFLELRRGQEFRPSEFLANFKGQGWAVGEAQKLLGELRAFLEEKIRSGGGQVKQWFDRPRPVSQMELETELRGVYDAVEERDEIISEKDTQIEELRARLEKLENTEKT